MDLVEKQAVIDTIMAVPDGNWRSIRYANEIKNLPSIKSDMIQCGYCAYHVPPAYCKKNDGIWRPFDYCSKAERLTNGSD